METTEPADFTTRPGGAYRVGRRPKLNALTDRMAAAGWRVFVLDGQKVSSKTELMAEIADQMNLPDHFGRNWDGLTDCLRDLIHAAGDAELHGVCVILSHADKLAIDEPSSLQMLASICTDLTAEGDSAMFIARTALVITGFDELTA